MFKPLNLSDVDETERETLTGPKDKFGQYPCGECGMHRPDFALVDLRGFPDKKDELPDFIGDCCWSDHRRYRRPMTKNPHEKVIKVRALAANASAHDKEKHNHEQQAADRKNWDIAWQGGHGASQSQINKIKASKARA